MRFDELLSIKTDKSAFESLKGQFSTEYVMNTQIEGFKFEIAAKGKETLEKVKEIEEILRQQ